MIKLSLYIAILITLACASAWMADAPGSVSVLWRGYQLDTSAAFLFFCFVAAIAFCAAAYLLTHNLILFPRRFRHRRRQRQYARGLQMVTQTLVALASADIPQARKLSAKAHAYLGDAPVTHLLDAQLARITHDEEGAKKALEHMFEHRDTKSLAARNLADYNARRGNMVRALHYAEQAQKMDPHNITVLKTTVGLHLQNGHWQEALHTVQGAQRRRTLPRKQAARLRAAIYYHQAAPLLASDPDRALNLADQAFHATPLFAPITAFYAKVLICAGQQTKAVRILKSAWKKQPNATLAEAITQLAESHPPADFYALSQKLASMHPSDFDSQLLLAKAALRARQWTSARRALKASISLEESATAFRLMAQLEQEEFRDGDAAAIWISKAATAPLSSLWICSSCNHASEQWHTHCSDCKSFDSLEWKRPDWLFPESLSA